MLPFLKKREGSIGSVISKKTTRGAEEIIDPKDEHHQALKECANDLLRGINMKDADLIAHALKNAFEISDFMPHVEGEHLNEEE